MKNKTSDFMDCILNKVFNEFKFEKINKNEYDPYNLIQTNYNRIIKKKDKIYELNIIEYNGFENIKGYVSWFKMPNGVIITNYNIYQTIRTLFDKLK